MTFAPWFGNSFPGNFPVHGNFPGLLGQDDQAYLRNQGLLNLGASLLAASGPSTTKTSFGQALGQGLLNQQQSQAQSMQALMQNKLIKTKLDEVEAERQRQQKLQGLIGQRGQTFVPGAGVGALENREGTGLLGAMERNDPNALRDFYANLSGLGGNFTNIGVTGLSTQTKTNQPTDFQRDLIAAGIAPDSPEGQQILKSRFDKTVLNPLQQIQVQQGLRDLQKPNLSEGQKAVDKKFADDYVEFKASGGFADVSKGIAQLREASDALKSGKNLTGPVLGRVPDAIKAFANPEAVSNKEAVQEIAQRNLRLVLGAQFTEKEGERLISRVYNENLEEPENAKRVDRLVKQIETAAKAKQEAAEYFEKHGTLAGFKGKIFSMSDFLNMDHGDDKSKPAKSEQTRPKNIVVDY